MKTKLSTFTIIEQDLQLLEKYFEDVDSYKALFPDTQKLILLSQEDFIELLKNTNSLIKLPLVRLEKNIALLAGKEQAKIKLEFELRLLNAKSRILKAKAPKTIEDYHSLVMILEQSTQKYERFYKPLIGNQAASKKKTKFFSVNLAKPKDISQIVAIENQLAALKTSFSLACQKIKAPHDQLGLYDMHINYISNLTNHIEDTYQRLFETQNQLRESEQKAVRTLTPKRLMSGIFKRPVKIVDPFIEKTKRSILRSFNLIFNPYRLLNSIENLMFHITQKRALTSPTQMASALAQIFQQMFEEMPEKDVKFLLVKFNIKAFGLITLFDRHYSGVASFNTEEIATSALDTNIVIAGQLKNSLEIMQRTLNEVAANRNINANVSSNSPIDSKKYLAHIERTICAINKRNQKRPALLTTSQDNLDAIWVERFSKDNAQVAFPHVHNKVFKLKSDDINLTDAKRLGLTIKDASGNRLAKFADTSMTNDAIKNTLSGLQNKYRFESSVLNFLLSHLQENSFIGESTSYFLSTIAKKDLIAKAIAHDVTLTIQKDGTIACHVVRDITSIVDPLNQPIIQSANNILARFDTTYLIKPAGKNEVKLLVYEHTTQVCNRELFLHYPEALSLENKVTSKRMLTA